MGEDALGQRQFGRHQESRPVDRMETDDVFAHHMEVGRPEILVQGGLGIRVSECRDVVGQSVQPDIHDMLGIIRYRNAPRESGARNRQVAQAAFDKADHFIAPAWRQDEIRILVIEFQQPLAPG